MIFLARTLHLEPKQIYISNVNRVYGQNFTRNAKDDFEYLEMLFSQPLQFLSINLCEYDPGLEVTLAI